jgi:isoamylase
LADLTAYNKKHNEDNGEGNNDGEDDNRSWNCGEEGSTDDPEVLELRERQRRNLLGTLLLSAGVPMVLGGDEIGRTQRGNNNAYCQDNEISWYDWANVDHNLLAFTKTALKLRRNSPALRPRQYLRGPEGGPPQMVLYRPDGNQMTAEDWQNAAARALAVALDGRQVTDADGDTNSDRLLLLLNAHHQPVEFTIPISPAIWKAVLTTGGPDDTPPITTRGTITLDARSLLLLQSSTSVPAALPSGPRRKNRPDKRGSGTPPGNAPGLPRSGAD